MPLLLIFGIALVFPACEGVTEVALQNTASLGKAPSSLPSQPKQPPSPTGQQRSFQIGALLFSGSGTWTSEVSSLENILSQHSLSYKKATSSEMNAMSVDDLSRFGMLIVPGGSGGSEGQSLTLQTHANLRKAVQKNGVGYVGFCAGAFIAVAPALEVASDSSYLGVVDGPKLSYYFLENQGVAFAMTLESFSDGTTQDILWYGGPETPNLPGGVIAKYPDGSPAITQLWSGNGFVILSGVHPTATQSMLNSLGMVSSDGVHLTLVWELLNSALQQKPLPAF